MPEGKSGRSIDGVVWIRDDLMGERVSLPFLQLGGQLMDGLFPEISVLDLSLL